MTLHQVEPGATATAWPEAAHLPAGRREEQQLPGGMEVHLVQQGPRGSAEQRAGRVGLPGPPEQPAP